MPYSFVLVYIGNTVWVFRLIFLYYDENSYTILLYKVNKTKVDLCINSKLNQPM